MAKSRPRKTPKVGGDQAGFRFEAANIDSLFEVLDAIAFLEMPGVPEVAQFAGIDSRTAGKLIKNGLTIGLIHSIDGKGYRLSAPYPFKGSAEQKRAVVREALVGMPLLQGVRQFMNLGEKLEGALRKAATVVGIRPYDPAAISPLVKWADKLSALEPGLVHEDLLDEAQAAKEQRHKSGEPKRVAFLSHSSKDKPIIRQLAADLNAAGIAVWLDEQRIKVGESIPDSIAQGLAESDVFVVALSASSVQSEWVKRELNNALVSEISKRRVRILPIKLDPNVEMPATIADKKYADFSTSYREGLRELIEGIEGSKNGD